MIVCSERKNKLIKTITELCLCDSAIKEMPQPHLCMPVGQTVKSTQGCQLYRSFHIHTILEAKKSCTL